jgi:hypothetical protein
MRPGGVKAMLAENMALRQQLLIACRGRKRSPDLSFSDRLSLRFLRVFCHHHSYKDQPYFKLNNYKWKQHCQGLVSLPIAA